MLHAPIDGVVLRVNASIGAAVEAGAVLFELGEPDALWIVADVFDNDLALIEKNAKATMQISALSEPVSGHVATVSAAMQTDLHRIVLPATAVLINDKKQTLVYVETADGLFEPRNVVIGQARDVQVPMLEGLGEADRVVVSGALLLDSAAAMLL